MTIQKKFFHLSKNIYFPESELVNNISGEITLRFIATKEGEIKNVIVVHGVHIILDKEFVRVFRELKVSSPAKINNKNIDICIEKTFTFSISR